MAYSESLAGRIRRALARRRGVVERKMFGGIGFLLHGNMLVGVWQTSLIVRVGPNQYQRALQQPHVREFDITGRPMKGWVLVEFTIGPSGTVVDPKVLDADPKNMFDDAALKAISRWKYNPKVENGVAVERRGIRVVLRFDLED